MTVLFGLFEEVTPHDQEIIIITHAVYRFHTYKITGISGSQLYDGQNPVTEFNYKKMIITIELPKIKIVFHLLLGTCSSC